MATNHEVVNANHWSHNPKVDRVAHLSSVQLHSEFAY